MSSTSSSNDMTKLLEDLIGAEFTKELILQYGGLQVYIPKNPEEADVLLLILNNESMAKLSDRFGGEFIDLPLNRRTLVRQRRERMQKLYSDGVSVLKIAKAIGVTRRTVYNALKEKNLVLPRPVTQKEKTPKRKNRKKRFKKSSKTKPVQSSGSKTKKTPKVR